MFSLSFACLLISSSLYLSSSRESTDQMCVPKSPLVISQVEQNIIFSLTNIAENSQTNFAWTYAENIGDGRGITFGIIGFTSGTYDGTQLIQKIKELDPTNELVSYLPAFLAIDQGQHTAEGLSNDTTGLDNFINDFNIHGSDTQVKIAQLDLLRNIYWNPAIRVANENGFELPLTVAELYDICINHGETATGNAKGLIQLVNDTNNAFGHRALWVDEVFWLNKLYDLRKAYLNTDPTWQQAIDRVEMHRRILQSGNLYLLSPFQVSCYGDNFSITGEAP